MIKSMCRSLGCVLTITVGLAAWFQPAVSGDPTAAAEKAYGDGEYETAFRKARKAIRQKPGDAHAHFIAGVSALELGEVEERQAKKHLERCLELRPDTPLAHYLLGFMAFRDAEAMGDERFENERRLLYASAAGHFAKELALQPELVKALGGRAIALRKAGGDIEPVVRAHDAWIAAAPRAPEPYLSLARMHIVNGDLEGAFAVGDRLPEQPPYLRSRFLIDLAVEYHERDLQEGFDRAVDELESDASGSWAALGRVLAHMDRGEVSAASEALVTIVQEGITDEMTDALARLFSAVPRKSFDKLLSAWTPNPDALKSGIWTLPQRTEHVFPEYPEQPRKARVEAEVFMLVVIRADGTPDVLRAVSTARGQGFARSSVAAIERWRYRPATKNGEPAAYIIVVKTDFSVQ